MSLKISVPDTHPSTAAHRAEALANDTKAGDAVQEAADELGESTLSSLEGLQPLLADLVAFTRVESGLIGKAAGRSPVLRDEFVDLSDPDDVDAMPANCVAEHERPRSAEPIPC